MSRLIFIGTLHDGLTPQTELIKIIQSFSPSMLLIEICQTDIDADDIKEYPDEMRAALNWGVKNNLRVRGFDHDLQVIRKEATKKDLEVLDKEQKTIIKKYDWKDFNKPRLEKMLRTESWHKIIDKPKYDEREQGMSKNIKELGKNSETTVVVTGSGHIPFFKNEFRSAFFPLS